MNKVFYGEYPLSHWVSLIIKRKIELPEYQRVFVWKQDDIGKMLDSLKDDKFIPPVTIGFYKDFLSGEKDLILDGQQRLTSILLLALGIYPPKDDQKNLQEFYNQSILANSNDDEIDLDDFVEEFTDWRFDKLLEYGSSLETIRKAALRNGYIDLKEQYSEVDELLDERHIGFSYIVPEIGQDEFSTDQDRIQTAYYASVFRSINSNGINLLGQESRAALYFLDRSKTDFFKPNFSKNIYVQSPGKNHHEQSIDFLRYLALISEYSTSKSFEANFVARGALRKGFESYYSDFIEAIIAQDNSSRFYTFEPMFNENIWTERLEAFFQILSLLKPDLTFESIIDSDIYVFGLLYYTLVQGVTFEKLIDNSEIREGFMLEIENLTNNLKNNPDYGYLHKKNPNALKYIRMRLEKSTETFSKVAWGN